LINLQQESPSAGLLARVRALEEALTGSGAPYPALSAGAKTDSRGYGIGAQVMVDLGITRMRFMTNHPSRVTGLEGFGLELTEWVPLVGAASADTRLAASA
jgi:3,4-dihydroxy 2-butanone 4-phosphate synthase/GTP cyclohydrolase II